MKAIIINDAEAKGLLDRLELKALREKNHWPQNAPETKEVLEAHRAFHFIVCQWLQDMGADVVRR